MNLPAYILDQACSSMKMKEPNIRETLPFQGFQICVVQDIHDAYVHQTLPLALF